MLDHLEFDPQNLKGIECDDPIQAAVTQVLVDVQAQVDPLIAEANTGTISHDTLLSGVSEALNASAPQHFRPQPISAKKSWIPERTLSLIDMRVQMCFYMRNFDEHIAIPEEFVIVNPQRLFNANLAVNRYCLMRCFLSWRMGVIYKRQVKDVKCSSRRDRVKVNEDLAASAERANELGDSKMLFRSIGKLAPPRSSVPVSALGDSPGRICQDDDTILSAFSEYRCQFLKPKMSQIPHRCLPFQVCQAIQAAILR